MKRWLMKKLGVFRKKHSVELDIISKIDRMGISAKDKDELVITVHDAFNRYF